MILNKVYKAVLFGYGTMGVRHRIFFENSGVHRMLYTQGEGLGNLLYHFVQVELLLHEDHTFLVEHGHLEHLLHKETQALALVADDAAEMVHHTLALGDAGVGEHLRSKRDA